MLQFASAYATAAPQSDIIRPSRRMLPREAATKYLVDKEGRPWSADAAPYMLEPLDLFASRRYRTIVFMGPARTSKTFSLVFGALTYIVTCSPGDTTVVQMSNETARSFSREEFDPIFRHSAELAKKLSPRARDNNTFDKTFISGMVVNFGWPAVTQLSGKTRKYMLVTDYDRPMNRDNVDGEGPLYDLALKRIETAMSRGKCLVESSPGEDYIDPQWAAKHDHEAPPAAGIASIYNRGTMAMLYWPCQDCGAFFRVKAGPEMFDLPEFEALLEVARGSDLQGFAAEYARVVCKQCGAIHRMEHRPRLNSGGQWVHSGETINAKGEIEGQRRNTSIASYWLGGAAAAYQRWDAMLLGYMEAVRVYEAIRDEGPLRTKTNTDFGAPYMPRSAATRRKAEDLIARAEEFPRGIVPVEAYFLTAAVDVQGNRFVVTVFAWGRGLESWVIERFSIVTSSTRRDGNMPSPIDPMTYVEDWDEIINQVVERKVPLAECTRLTMSPVLTMVDSGGRAIKEGPSTTQRSYEFWRRARDRGYGRKVFLLKGTGNPAASRATMAWPDASTRGDRSSGALGDVPVWLLNTNVWKDAIFGDLGREQAGPGFVHLPKWADRGFFAEYVAEVRTKKGWEKETPGIRNESADLHVYNRVAAFVLGAEQLDWDAPPEWAKRPKPVPDPLTPPLASERVAQPDADGIEWRPGSYL